MVPVLKSLAPELRGKMYAELAKYCYHQLRAVEVSGLDAGPVRAEQRMVVEFVEANSMQV
jgi:hypothetical protein